jgi:hypothetical protein
MHVRIINIESKTGAIIGIFLKFTMFSTFLVKFSFWQYPFKHTKFSFLTHLSWKLKWAILIARCPSVCLSVNFYFLSRTTGPILTRLSTNHPWGEGIQVCSNEGRCPSLRGDNSKRVKIHKIYFNISRTSEQISVKLGTNYPWMKGIQVCSTKRPVFFSRGR